VKDGRGGDQVVDVIDGAVSLAVFAREGASALCETRWGEDGGYARRCSRPPLEAMPLMLDLIPNPVRAARMWVWDRTPGYVFFMRVMRGEGLFDDA